MIDSAPLFPRFSVINPHNSRDKVYARRAYRAE